MYFNTLNLTRTLLMKYTKPGKAVVLQISTGIPVDITEYFKKVIDRLLRIASQSRSYGKMLMVYEGFICAFCFVFHGELLINSVVTGKVDKLLHVNK